MSLTLPLIGGRSYGSLFTSCDSAPPSPKRPAPPPPPAAAKPFAPAAGEPDGAFIIPSATSFFPPPLQALPFPTPSKPLAFGRRPTLPEGVRMPSSSLFRLLFFYFFYSFLTVTPTWLLIAWTFCSIPASAATPFQVCSFPLLLLVAPSTPSQVLRLLSTTMNITLSLIQFFEYMLHMMYNNELEH